LRLGPELFTYKPPPTPRRRRPAPKAITPRPRTPKITTPTTLSLTNLARKRTTARPLTYTRPIPASPSKRPQAKNKQKLIIRLPIRVTTSELELRGKQLYKQGLEHTQMTGVRSLRSIRAEQRCKQEQEHKQVEHKQEHIHKRSKRSMRTEQQQGQQGDHVSRETDQLEQVLRSKRSC